MLSILPKKPRSLSFLKVFGLAFIVSLSSACSVTDRVVYQDAEGEIPASLFNDITEQRLSPEQIKLHLGNPERIEKIGDELTVMTYRFSRSQVRNWQALYAFRVGGRQDDAAYYHIASKNGEVKKSWVDDAFQVQSHYQLVHDITPPPPKAKKPFFRWKMPAWKSWFKGDDASEPKMHQEQSAPAMNSAVPTQNEAMSSENAMQNEAKPEMNGEAKEDAPKEDKPKERVSEFTGEPFELGL